MGRRKSGRYDRDFSRRGAMREPGRTFLIVVEGAETERVYFEGLCGKLGLKTARVHIHHPEFTDPIGLVETAIRLAAQRRDDAKKSVAVVSFDEVWVVFDTEAQNDSRAPQIPAARQKAKTNGVKLAVSNPTFEIWIRLHFGYTTTFYENGAKVSRDIKRNHHKGYDKCRPPIAMLLTKIDDAVKHAKRCQKHHADCAGDGNPSTEVFELVIALNEAAPIPLF